VSAPRRALGAVRAAVAALRLPRAERRAALAALTALAVAVRALSRGGLAGAERRLAAMPRLLPRRCAVSPARLAVLVRAVAKQVPRAECLAQSLVLGRLIVELGHRSVTVRIGVRPGEASLAAHAWVEVDGAVVNDAADVAARFPVIETRSCR